MTAHTPPTPPAMRERKLESVCFEASTTSVLTSSAEGIEGPVDDDEEDGIFGAKRRTDQNVERKQSNRSFLLWDDGIWELGSRTLRTDSRGTILPSLPSAAQQQKMALKRSSR